MPTLRLVLATTALVALAACSQPQPVASTPRPVLAQVVKPADNALGNVYSGEVRARHESDLAFRVGGKLVARYVDVGTRVTRGTVLARLDPQDARLAVDAARSQLSAAQADHSLAKSELERYRQLFAQKFVSQAVLDSRQTTFDATKAKLEQATAQLSTAQNQSAYTTLSADADGVITAVSAELGQVVAAGQPVMRLARPDEKEVVINVPESRLTALRDARQILVALWTQPQRPYTGQVREISPTADPVTRTFTVKVSVPEAGAAVRLGMTANVLVDDPGERIAVKLPLGAVDQSAGTASVWIVDPQSRKVAPHPVEIGAFREDGVTVRSGVSAGDVVVTAGVQKLVAGETVRLAPEVERAMLAVTAARTADANSSNGG
jgi:membrane fusion protein, multidrug efflux system